MPPESPPRVYFDEFNPDSLSIRFFYWYSPPDNWAFSDFSERVNFEIIRRFAEAGIALAPPTSRTQITDESGQPVALPMPEGSSAQKLAHSAPGQNGSRGIGDLLLGSRLERRGGLSLWCLLVLALLALFLLGRRGRVVRHLAPLLSLDRLLISPFPSAFVDRWRHLLVLRQCCHGAVDDPGVGVRVVHVDRLLLAAAHRDLRSHFPRSLGIDDVELELLLRAREIECRAASHRRVRVLVVLAGSGRDHEKHGNGETHPRGAGYAARLERAPAFVRPPSIGVFVLIVTFLFPVCQQ